MESTLIDKARSFQQKGDLTNAEIYFKQTLEDPDLAAEGHGELGNLMMSKGDINQAIGHWKRSLELDANHFESLCNLGYMLCQAQDFNNALIYLEKAHEINPERDDVAMQIAQIRCQLGQVDLAEGILNALVDKKTDNENVHLLMAQVKAMNNNMKGAEDCLLELLTIKPNLPEALINLGQIKESAGDIDKATEYYETATTKAPYHFQAKMEYGRFLSNIGRLEEGLEYLQSAAKIQPSDFGVNVHLGNLYQELGEFDKAISAYKKSLTINPQDLGVKQNLSRVLSRFVPPWHLKMLADHERNEAFEKAIKKAVKSDSVVLDIGTGSGILSMMAARAGAQKVFTCEQSKYIADAALENIRKNGYESNIKLFPKKSTQIAPEDLTETPNVVVAEIFDSGLLGEHAIPSFRHAISQLCGSNTQVIPKSAEVKGKLIHAEKLASVNPVKNISGLDLSAFDQFRVAEEYITQNLSEITHEFCSDEFDMLSVNFNEPWEPFAPGQYKWFDIKVKVTSNNPIHGIAFWYTLHLDDKIKLSSEPGRPDNHWGQAISFFDSPLTVREGNTMKFTLCYNDIKIWIAEPQVLSEI